MTWTWTPETTDALTAYLSDHGITSGPVVTSPIGDGHSNLTFRVSDGERSVVLRRPPPPPVPPGAHDMLREARFIGALGGTGVPVADLLAVVQTGEVLDVPFYVMSHVVGPVITVETPAPLDNPADRALIGTSLVDTLAALHAVDVDAAGLSDLGRPGNFNARHLRSVGRLVNSEDGTPPAEFAPIDAWLKERIPEQSGTSVIHNDYRIGNVIVAPDSPGRIAAVLDWELATIGDPLFDLGYFLSSWPEPGEELTPTGEFGVAAFEQGYPRRADLAQRYATATGRDLSNIDWYHALALWKVACLYEYGRRRAARGVGDQYYRDPAKVRSFLQAAHQVAGLDQPVPVSA